MVKKILFASFGLFLLSTPLIAVAQTITLPALPANASNAQLQAEIQQLIAIITQLLAARGGVILPPPVPIATSSPSASFTATPTSGAAPLAVNFTAMVHTFGANYKVVFGDGTSAPLHTSATTQVCPPGGNCVPGSASHTYTTPGTYKAMLETDPCPGQACLAPVQILGIAMITVGGTQLTTLSATPTSGPAPLAVTFKDIVSQPFGQYEISYGDGQDSGSITALSDPSVPGGMVSAQHTYASAGTYNAIIVSAGPCPQGPAGTVTTCEHVILGTATITVTGTSSTASFTATPTSGVAPLQVSFTSPQGAVGDTVNFGDGTSGIMSLVVATCPLSGPTNSCGPHSVVWHTYQSPGTYTTTLADSSGNTLGTATVAVTGGTSQTFTATPTSGSTPLGVEFNATVALPFGHYEIEYGDGKNSGSIVALSDPGVPGGLISAQHTYTAPGTYTAWLMTAGPCPQGPAGTITTITNCEPAILGTATITVTDGTAQKFTAAPTSGTAPLTVNFSGVGTTIQFGDGTGQAQTDGIGLNQTSYTYKIPGTYTATSNGSSVTITVTAGNSQTFTAAPTSGSAPFAVTFNTGSITSGTITFGDGTNAPVNAYACTASIPASCAYGATHTYTAPGTYTATLTEQPTCPIDPAQCGFPQTIGTATITVTSTTTGTGPTLVSLNPSQASVGSPVIINGTGFLTIGGNQIYFDGVSAFGSGNSANGTSLSFLVPPIIYPSCQSNSCAGEVISAGQHQIMVSNVNGKSNTLLLNVTSASTVMAAIDKSSFDSHSATPFINGTANISQVIVSINPPLGATIYNSGPIPVINNLWSTTVSPALAAGPYTVSVYPVNGNGIPLTTATFTVSGSTAKPSLIVSAASTPLANQIMAGGLTIVFANINLDASQSSEDVRLTSLPIAVTTQGTNNADASDLSGCQLWHGSTPLNSQAVNSQNWSNGKAVVSFDNALIIPKGTVVALALTCNLSNNPRGTSWAAGVVNSAPFPLAYGETTGVSLTSSNGDLVVRTSMSGTMSIGHASLVATNPTPISFTQVAGGNTGVTVGSFTLQPKGDSVNLQSIGLTLNAADASPSDVTRAYIYQGTNLIGSVIFTGSPTGGFYHATSTIAAGPTLNPALPLNVQANFTIKADISAIGIGQAGTDGHEVIINLADAQGVGASSGTAVHSGPLAASRTGVAIFRSIPTIALSSFLPNAGIEDGRLIAFTVTASPNGPIGIGQLDFGITSSPGTTVTAPALYAYIDPGFSQPAAGTAGGGAAGSTAVSGAYAKTMFSTPLEIPAGATEYFLLHGTVRSTASFFSVATTLLGSVTNLAPHMYVATAAYNFMWSPNGQTTAAPTTVDWSNAYGIAGLPAAGIVENRTGGAGTVATSTTASASQFSNLASVLVALQALLKSLGTAQ